MKLLKNILLVIAIVLFGLFTILFIYVRFNQEEIKKDILASINKQLVKTVDVKSVDFSILNNFPNVSLEFNELRIFSKEDTLLSLKKLSAKFSIIDIYYGRYNLSGIEIYDGNVSIINERDYQNYLLLKQDSISDNPFNIDIRNLKSEKVHFSLKTHAGQHSFSIIDLRLKVKKKEDFVSFSLNGNISNLNITVADDSYSFLDNTNLDIHGNWDNENKILSFSKTETKIAGFYTDLDGSINFKNAANFNLNFILNDVEPSELKPFLKEDYFKTISENDAKGKFDFKGKIAGEWSKTSIPEIDISYTLNNGSWGKDSSLIKITTASGKLENSSNSFILFVDTIEASYFDLNIKGSGKVSEFSNPIYKGRLNFSTEIEKLAPVFKLDKNWSLSGKVNGTANLKGEINEIDTYSYSTWKKYKQNVSLEVAELNIKYDSTYIIEETYLHLNCQSNNLTLDSINGIIQKQKILAQLDISNFYSLLDTGENSIINGKVSSTSLIIENWLNWPIHSEEESKWSPKIFLDVKADQVEFKNATARNVSSQLLIREGDLFLKDAHLNAFNGNIRGDLNYQFSNAKKSLSSKLIGEKLDISLLFKEYNNFGQTTLTDKNISGNASLELDFYTEFDEDNNVIPKSIVAHSDLEIVNGRLRGFEPIYRLSKFVELEELKDIKFDTLKNQILIKDELIYIPKFGIKNTALDIIMEGTHSFNNQVDYSFTMFLSEILKKKIKKNPNEDMGYIEDDGLGRSRLFIKMKGDISSPEIKYDKQGLKKYWNEEIKDEKQEIRSILNKEFGMFKKDTTLNYKGIESKDKASPFVIEWEEKEKKSPKKETKPNPEDKKSNKKGKVGKFIDKIAKPNEEEYVSPPQ